MKALPKTSTLSVVFTGEAPPSLQPFLTDGDRIPHIAEFRRSLAPSRQEAIVNDIQLALGIGLAALVVNPDDPIARLEVGSDRFLLRPAEVGMRERLRLNRWSFARVDDDGSFVLESARYGNRLVVFKEEAFAFLFRLAKGSCLEELGAWNPEDRQALAQCLQMGCFLEVAVEADSGVPTENEHGWEFHDLLFHTRSRLGTANGVVGASYRFKGEKPPSPALKPKPPEAISILLPRPDPYDNLLNRTSLLAVIEQRRSVRSYYLPLLTLDDLSAFLYFSARVKSQSIHDGVEFTSRPYPSGGASYELELYLTIRNVSGLYDGLYYYNALEHSLMPISMLTPEVDMLRRDASVSMACLGEPQVLISIAARFHRLQWKYSRIAYAAILKHVGVVYQTFYLVGTALGIGCCALGVGNSQLFCRVAHTALLDESTVGEFALAGRMN
jgi:SagB-type dehydrogenase family enzyme